MNKEFNKEWSIFKLGELIKEKKDFSTRNNQYPILSVTKNGIIPQSSYFLKQIASKDNIGYKILKKNDLVFSTMNLWMGSIDVLSLSEIGIVSPAYKTFTFDKKLCDSKFMSYFMKDVNMIKKYILHSEQGASIVRRNLDLDNLLKESVCIPSLEEQKKIAYIISTIEDANFKIKSKIIKIQNIKKSIINRLLKYGAFCNDLKDSEIGKIPKNWKIQKLKDLGSCIRGLTYSPKDISDQGLLVLRSSNIQNEEILLEDNVYVKLTIKEKFLSKKSDILICVRNGSRNLIGKSAILKKDLKNCTHGAFMTIFRSKYNDFVQYLFKSDKFFNYVSQDIGATINSINTNNFLNYKFAIPPRDEQIKILNILEKINKSILINKKKQLKYESLKRSVMQDLLTRKFTVTIN